MAITQARFPRTRKATRQSYSLISQRVRGARARMPSVTRIGSQTMPSQIPARASD